ncbi:hypothetical protein F7725_027189 [Dissostichus mawsoni]|uniref:Uncharacterized protein n=1 Tax=Dissostichus mawsoni TaxID=36200 RepID=A0A7J5XCF9_DISMA|nr:hypothetical protein F7725_027189 [Dissostichus mawsoni]
MTLTLSPPIGTQTLTPIWTMTLTLSPSIGPYPSPCLLPSGPKPSPPSGPYPHPVSSHRDPNPHPHRDHNPHPHLVSPHRDPNPHPVSSHRDPNPHPVSPHRDPHPVSPESFLSGYKLVSSSLEQPLSLCSNPPSGNLFHHTLSPYSCAPPGAACFAQLPPDAFRGPKPWPPPNTLHTTPTVSLL